MMATNYGTGIKALTDFPIRGELVSGLDLAAYRLARRLLTPTDGYADCGDPTPYLSLDLRQQIGARLAPGDLAQLERQCVSALREEDSVDAAVVTLVTEGTALRVEVQGTGADGPFGWVMSVTDVTAEILESF